MKDHAERHREWTRSAGAGFTLVELLIVTVIIGIIAGMMMIIMGEATDRASAIRLINDLRLIKTACLEYFLDNRNLPGDKLLPGGYESVAKSLEVYFDKPLMDAYGGKIYVTSSNDRAYYGLIPDNVSFALNAGALKKLEIIGIVYDEEGNRFKAGGGHDAGPYYVIIK
ncbi:MAG: prepilin-type N-terminal cleavage/methylation domain-containing protein [Synergistaceae bacterium]|nr:prepilin-type N-terminal cleavage/methylation domain-containing protein [Synergistaceae bacterium]